MHLWTYIISNSLLKMWIYFYFWYISNSLFQIFQSLSIYSIITLFLSITQTLLLSSSFLSFSFSLFLSFSFSFTPSLSFSFSIFLSFSFLQFSFPLFILFLTFLFSFTLSLFFFIILLFYFFIFFLCVWNWFAKRRATSRVLNSDMNIIGSTSTCFMQCAWKRLSKPVWQNWIASRLLWNFWLLWFEISSPT